MNIGEASANAMLQEDAYCSEHGEFYALHEVCPTCEMARNARPAGIGDITSDAKGSGARFNGGKPDFSLVPLTMVAGASRSFNRLAVLALEQLGLFQVEHDTAYLFTLLHQLGDEGWEECARVFEYGKRKYAAWNWAKGMPWSVPLACAARHLLAMIRGEDTDPESGEPHRGHVFCNVVMLLQYTKTYTEGNDLPPRGMF
jgi:hypothetical protein